MTPYKKVYDAFLAKARDDDWSNPEDMDIFLMDWRSILESAIPFFKFPKISLERDEFGFVNDLNDDEIQILANLMKEEWLSRIIYSWDNVKVMFDERDFSQANMLSKLTSLLENTQNKNRKLQKMYSRSIINSNGEKKPYPYSKFAGGDNL